MKSFLEYYYNLLNITVTEKNGIYYLFHNNKNYVFLNTIRNIEEIDIIYKLNNNLEKYHQIVINRNNSCITFFNNKPYVLLQLKHVDGNIDKTDLIKKEIIYTKNMNVLLRNDWVKLIETKIDYIEYQRTHFKKKYSILDSSLDYYIGLAENSISYVNQTNLNLRKNNLDNLVICHRRIRDSSRFSFYNPLDIIIDHPSRDISGYLKELFLRNTYNINILTDLFKSLRLSQYGFQMLFGRMLYPSFYFDTYERIINECEDERKIIEIIKRQKEYENYLHTIYMLINKNTKIPSIDWI